MQESSDRDFQMARQPGAEPEQKPTEAREIFVYSKEPYASSKDFAPKKGGAIVGPKAPELPATESVTPSGEIQNPETFQPPQLEQPASAEKVSLVRERRRSTRSLTPETSAGKIEPPVPNQV